MKSFVFARFGLEHLAPIEVDAPAPAPREIVLDVRALSLNYRDLLVVKGLYNPRLRLPAVPVSDASGIVEAVGERVTSVRPGDRVMTHFVPDWNDGPYRFEYLRTTLGTPGPGLAAEQVALPEAAVLPVPDGYGFVEAAALPIAGLTAWNALVTTAGLTPGQTVLTLGTGGVAVFVLQIAKALGARVVVTSSSDDKLARARALGADETINYRTRPDWDAAVNELTAGGADVTVETAGAATINQSLAATRPGGTVALLGALTGLKAEVNTGLLMMKQLRVCGILVGSRREFGELSRFLVQHRIRPVIDRTLPFDALPAALRELEAARHFGKIALEREGESGNPRAFGTRSAS